MQDTVRRGGRLFRNQPRGCSKCARRLSQRWGRLWWTRTHRPLVDSVLDHAAEAIEIEDIEPRVSELERAAERSK